MSFLTGIEIRKLISERKIIINSLDPRYSFDVNQQVTEDAIDLRLSPFGLRYKQDVRSVDYLKDNLEMLFESFVLPIDKGYEIRPGKILFTQTLEAITFPDNLVGLVVARSTFARLGLMVNCGAPKFAIGISWAFPLQLVNCGSIPIVMYPYTVVAQLMISTVEGQPVGYQGRYQNSYTPLPPVILERERKFLQDLSADSAKRTFHILVREIEAHRQQIKDEAELVLSKRAAGVQMHQGESVVSTSDKPTSRKPGELIKLIVRTMLAIFGSLCFGIVGNLLSSEEQSYWKSVSMVVIVILGLILILVPIFLLKNVDQSEAN